MSSPPVPEGTGEALYRLFQAGDTAALETLFALCQPGLRAFIAGYGLGASEISAMITEVFAQITTNKSQFRGDSSFETYLYAVAKYVTLRHIKQEQRHEHLPLDEETATALSAEDEYIRKDESERLSRAIDALPPHYGAVIRLVYFEGCSYAEAGERVGKKAKQVDHLLQRAKAALKKQLEND